MTNSLGDDFKTQNTSGFNPFFSWQFTPEEAQSFISIKPPDIAPTTLGPNQRSVELAGLTAGTPYKVQIFPFIGGEFNASTSIGDPIVIPFEVELQKPNLVINNYDDTSICGSAFIPGNFIRAEVYLLDSYRDPVVLLDKDRLEWCFAELIPAISYFFGMSVFTEKNSFPSDALEATTKPSAPYLKEQTVDKNEQTAFIVIGFPELVNGFDYKIICNSMEMSHESYRDKYRQTFAFTTEAAHFGCTFEIWSYLNASQSSKLTLNIGVSVIEDLFLEKSAIDNVDLYWSYRTGFMSKLLVVYEAPPSHVYAKYFPRGSMPCPLGPLPVRYWPC